MRLFAPICALGLLLTGLPGLAAAQDTTGSISGTVTDEQNAVLPGVTILVTQTATGAERSQVSDELVIPCSSSSAGPLPAVR